MHLGETPGDVGFKVQVEETQAQRILKRHSLGGRPHVRITCQGGKERECNKKWGVVINLC